MKICIRNNTHEYGKSESDDRAGYVKSLVNISLRRSDDALLRLLQHVEPD
jgi:hypothetical protein